jgi:uncharacterized protein (DUF427 family)
MTTLGGRTHAPETTGSDRRIWMKAVWKGVVLAESDETIVVEGNHHFPPDSVRREYLRASDKKTTCPWKGQASYYDLVVDGQVNADAAWTYSAPKPAAERIKDYIAFWRGVQVGW